MVVIKQQLVASTAKTFGGTNGRKYIAIHETANKTRGANAQAHANLQSKGFSASWHWQVDDKEAIQSFPHTAQCWHGGDGRGDGNLNSIGVEICVNSDGDFTKAVENAAALVRKIMADEGIPISDVKQHHFFSGKNCPTNLRNGSKGVNWSDFLRMLEVTEIPKADIATQRGIATVTVPTLSLRKSPSIKGAFIRELKKGEAYKVWDEVGGWLNLGNDQWASWQNGVYMDWSERPNVKTVSKPVASEVVLKKSTVHLPKSAKAWRTYKLNVQPVAANSDWSLTPSVFGGLTYEILDRPYANVVTINTSRGKRNIFVGAGTGAVIK